MKSGAYYFYEYKNNQKSRNVGFLKLSQQLNSCILQLCTRGLSVFQNDSASLSALYSFEEHFLAHPVESVTCENHAITCRLEIPIQILSKEHPLDHLAGFLLELPDGSYIAATEETYHFTPAHLTDSAPVPPSVPDKEAVLSQKTDEPVPEEKDIEPSNAEENFRKLSRSELSVLPRQYWHLANNSFLLHGYYNYNHLLLIEEDGHFLLGVPGIYDKQEARAAALFGFPLFSESHANQIGLSEDDLKNPGTFGHWFREIPK